MGLSPFGGTVQQPIQQPPANYMAPSTLAPGGPISNTTPNRDQQGLQFMSPRRPNYGKLGDQILLRANHFQVRVPGSVLHHYEVLIQPDRCPRRVNR